MSLGIMGLGLGVCPSGVVIAGDIAIDVNADTQVVDLKIDTQDVDVKVSTITIVLTDDGGTIVKCGSETIYQGDTPNPRRIRIKGIDSGDTTCEQAVVSLAGSTVVSSTVATQVVYDGNTYWHVFLTPTDTDALTPGETYTWVIQISATGSTPPVRREVRIELLVDKQLIP